MKKILAIGFSLFLLSWMTPLVSAQDAGHEGHNHGAVTEQPVSMDTAAVYTCPMHPAVVSAEEGRCPECGMLLEKKTPEAGWDSVTGGSTMGTAVIGTAIDARNEICPVSDEPVSGKNFATYQGKSYGFCCDACINKFNKNPEKYLKSL